jgi:Uma2 family endonuclease
LNPLSGQITWAEFLTLPDSPRYRYAELVDGVIVGDHPPPWLHQHVMGELLAEFGIWCAAGPARGAVTRKPPVEIRAARGYLPDIAWHRDGRDRPPPGQPHLSGVPDLVVEVISPFDRPSHVIRKRTDYARVGVRELWLIDPQEPAAFVLRTSDPAAESAEFVLVEELGENGVLSSPMLPGLAVRLADLMPS